MMTTNTNNPEILSQFENLTQIQILNRILLVCNRENLQWAHSAAERESICEVLGISEINFKKSITRMREMGLLLHVQRGKYQINNNLITNYED